MWEISKSPGPMITQADYIKAWKKDKKDRTRWQPWTFYVNVTRPDKPVKELPPDMEPLDITLFYKRRGSPSSRHENFISNAF
jgi:hypothetical protein